MFSAGIIKAFKIEKMNLWLPISIIPRRFYIILTGSFCLFALRLLRDDFFKGTSNK